MAQLDIPSCSLKGREIDSGEVNDEGQTQRNAAAESWVFQVKSALDGRFAMWRLSKNVCIYRVIKRIWISKPEAYVPFVVSFGPYHHKINPKFSTMDQHKLEAVHRMSARLKIHVSSLIREIQKSEVKIRMCYDEAIDLDGETLSLMLAMDACFILEFFKSFAPRREESDIDCISLVFQNNGGENSLFGDIVDDIMKLENQIPLFILIILLQLELRTHEQAITQLAAVLSKIDVFCGFPFFSADDEEFNNEYMMNRVKRCMMQDPPPCHLLDLCRMVIRDVLTNSSAESGIELDGCGGADNINNDHGRCGLSMNVALPGCMQRLTCSELRRLALTRSPDDSRSTPSAELLHKAGIKFQAGRLGFRKRRFGRSTFSLPQIIIVERTETMLRNLMAYEECQRCSSSPQQTVISNFVRLLQDLIDSEKDVFLLRKSLVIQSWIGRDQDIAGIFNRLGDGITFDFIGEFEVVMQKAREHYNSRWRVWWSQLKKDIFSQPWYILTLVTAILMLGMTAVQTVMTAVQTVYTMKN